MDENEIFENRHFVLSKQLLMTLGLWPYAKRSLKLSLRTIMLVVGHSMLIPMLIRYFEEWNAEIRNYQIVAENFAFFLYYQGIVSKIFMSINNEKKLQRLYKEMTKDYKDIQEPNERKAMLELWNFARMLCIIYTFYLFLAFHFLILTPVALPVVFDLISPLNESRPKTLCYYAEYYVDQQKYLWPLILHTYVGAGSTVFVETAVDTSYICLTYHVLALLNLINCRLKMVSEWADKRINRNHEKIHRFLIGTIRIHKKTIDFAEEVRTTFDAGNFYTFGLGLGALAIGSIAVVSKYKNPNIVLRIGMIWFGLICYFFFINWPGQRFLDSSDDLLQSIWFCKWYKLPKKTQVLLNFMMMRSSIPFHQLTAGPLVQLNFFTYGLILRTALSYFTAVTSFTYVCLLLSTLCIFSHDRTVSVVQYDTDLCKNSK